MGRERLAQTLTPQQKEILFGSLLGDARLECRSHSGSARLRIHHAESQRTYLLWKYDIFRPFVMREPWNIRWFDHRTRKEYQSWFFHTKTMMEFRPYHQMFYANGKKFLPGTIEDLLTPRALAVWFMDDGCCFSKGATLNTQSFSLHENAVLQNVFLKKFSIHVSIQRDRRNFRLTMNRKNFDILFRIMRSHIPLSMQRKFLPVTTDPASLPAGWVGVR